MFKVKVVKSVGEIKTVVEVETDNENMVLGILRHCDVISVHSDAPNINIDTDWQHLLQRVREQELPMAPFTVTC